MTLVMLDALHWRDVPLDTQFDIGCGYMDHPDDETSYQDMVRLFPGRHYFGIVIDPAHNYGDILDIENGDARPDQVPAWTVMRRQAGLANPIGYCNQSNNWQACIDACVANKIAQPWWWVARYDGIQNIPIGAVAKQYTDNPPQNLYDTSVGQDILLGIPVPPIPPIVKEDPMFLVEYQNGYWIVSFDLTTRMHVKGDDTADNYNNLFNTGKFVSLALGDAQMASIPIVTATV